MKAILVSGLLGATLFLSPANAQQRQTQQKTEGASMTVTGCLAQGDERNEYSIKDASGKTYGLQAGSDVNLKAHLGHRVTITGTPMKESEKSEQRESRESKDASTRESGHLRVESLTMVSTSCQ